MCRCKEMQIGFYSGSFDPFTNGHLHVVKQSACLFDELIVGIGINDEKHRRFDKDLMKNAMEAVFKREKLDNVSVITYNKLTVDVALEYYTSYLVRGIRNGIDYDYEENIAAINEEMSGLNTIYIRAGSMGNISSSMIMLLLNSGRDVSKYLPKEIMKLVISK